MTFRAAFGSTHSYGRAYGYGGDIDQNPVVLLTDAALEAVLAYDSLAFIVYRKPLQGSLSVEPLYRGSSAEPLFGGTVLVALILPLDLDFLA